jgi:hypothetical protein
MAKKRSVRKGTATKKPKTISLSIDLSALDKLYRKRYEVALDGDTKGSVRVVLDGDTKGGSVRILDGDGDTKGGALPRPGTIQEAGARRKSTRRG